MTPSPASSTRPPPRYARALPPRHHRPLGRPRGRKKGAEEAEVSAGRPAIGPRAGSGLRGLHGRPPGPDSADHACGDGRLGPAWRSPPPGGVVRDPRQPPSGCRGLAPLENPGTGPQPLPLPRWRSPAPSLPAQPLGPRTPSPARLGAGGGGAGCCIPGVSGAQVPAPAPPPSPRSQAPNTLPPGSDPSAPLLPPLPAPHLGTHTPFPGPPGSASHPRPPAPPMAGPLGRQQPLTLYPSVSNSVCLSVYLPSPPPPHGSDLFARLYLSKPLCFLFITVPVGCPALGGGGGHPVLLLPLLCLSISTLCLWAHTSVALSSLRLNT